MLGVLVPSRGRPGNLRRLVDAIAKTATGEYPRASLEGLTQGVATIEANYAAWSKRARERAEYIATRQAQELARLVEWLPTHPCLSDHSRRRRALTIRTR